MKIKDLASPKLISQIVKILEDNNPGCDFGVNPKILSEELKLKYDVDITPIQVGHILKNMGFTEKFISGKLYRTIYINKLSEIKAMLDSSIDYN